MGDKGQTALVGGRRISKGSLRLEAYGAVDTLNAYVGMVADRDRTYLSFLRNIQETLFRVGANLAHDPKKKKRANFPGINQADVDILEQAIDEMSEVLTPLRNFILPGGHQRVSFCHLARCHCREAERKCVRLAESGEEIPEFIIPYLNRLGDYLFVLARHTAFRLGVEEIPWRPK